MDTTTQQIDVLNAAAWAKRNVQVEATLVESQQTYDLAEKAGGNRFDRRLAGW